MAGSTFFNSHTLKPSYEQLRKREKYGKPGVQPMLTKTNKVQKLRPACMGRRAYNA